MWFKTCSRWFWMIGLGTGVLMFLAMAVISVIFAIQDHAPRLLLPALGCTVFAYRAWQPLRVRIWGPDPVVRPLDIDF